jgi:hypothetical protein
MTTVEDSISVGSLTYDERHEFEMCVETIDRGFKVWYEVGKALLKIRDKRLYREEHQTFEACVQERWGLKRQRAYELMGASQVVENLSEISDTPPRYESHVAPLSILAPDEQRAVWSLVEQTAPGGKVTAAHVKSLVTVVTEIVHTGAIDDGTGQSIPVGEARIEHVKAAVIEETYERMQRQESHIRNSDKPLPRRIWKGNVTVGMFQADESLVIMTCDTPPGIETGKRYKVTIEAIEE